MIDTELSAIFQNCADAIRSKTGSLSTYLPSELPDGIMSIPQTAPVQPIQTNPTVFELTPGYKCWQLSGDLDKEKRRQICNDQSNDLTGLILGSDLTSIGQDYFQNVFMQFYNLQNIEAKYATSLTYIGQSTFLACLNLSGDINFPALTQTWNRVFEQTSINSFRADNMTSLGDNNFSECRKITSIIIPNVVLQTRICGSVGYWGQGNPNLREIRLKGIQSYANAFAFECVPSGCQIYLTDSSQGTSTHVLSLTQILENTDTGVIFHCSDGKKIIYQSGQWTAVAE